MVYRLCVCVRWVGCFIYIYTCVGIKVAYSRSYLNWIMFTAVLGCCVVISTGAHTLSETIKNQSLSHTHMHLALSLLFK